MNRKPTSTIHDNSAPLRRTLARNPDGGSYKLRVRVPQGKNMVYKTVEIGLGTRDEDTAAYVAAVILSSIDKVFELHRPRLYILDPDADHVITWEQISKARKATSIAMRRKSGKRAAKPAKLAHQLTFDFPDTGSENHTK